jgi:hypothetical protein
MPILDQIYNAPSSLSHTLLGGAIIFILGLVGIIVSIRRRK